MAFIPSASTVTLTARLTPYGRQQLLANADNIITYFSLGDSDANYRATSELQLGDVPSSAGLLGYDDSLNNSLTSGVKIKNKILVNSSGATMKAVSVNSTNINSTQKKIGLKSVNETDLRVLKVNRSEYLTDSLTNLFASFGLPITETSQNIFDNVPSNSGGLSNTALKWLNQDKILVLSIDGVDFGEMIDGRVIKMDITTSGGTYVAYSSYQKTLTSPAVQDTNTSETSIQSSMIGDNIVFLFSDNIQRPNNNVIKSWSTGFNTVKPFSVNKKELFNFVTNSSISAVADRAIGVAYLDKGFLVITEPAIVNSYVVNDSIDIEFESLVTEVSQDITCIVERGEFNKSVNLTYNSGDLIRISEVGLYDSSGNLMALAKTNKHILIGANQFLALGIKISV